MQSGFTYFPLYCEKGEDLNKSECNRRGPSISKINLAKSKLMLQQMVHKLGAGHSSIRPWPNKLFQTMGPCLAIGFHHIKLQDPRPIDKLRLLIDVKLKVWWVLMWDLNNCTSWHAACAWQVVRLWDWLSDPIMPHCWCRGNPGSWSRTLPAIGSLHPPAWQPHQLTSTPSLSNTWESWRALSGVLWRLGAPATCSIKGVLGTSHKIITHIIPHVIIPLIECVARWLLKTWLTRALCEHTGPLTWIQLYD